jgi:hypothetical protein
MKAKTGFVLAGIVLTAFSWAYGARRNWTPDAVTRATTWNEYQGDLSALFDGKYPGNEGSPAFFLWEGKGVLLFDFPEPVALAQFRVYVGAQSGFYTLRAYLGGHASGDGVGREPWGELKERVENGEMLTNQWVTFALPPSTVVDNLEFSAIGTSEYYEIELLGPEETPVRDARWGSIKAMRR